MLYYIIIVTFLSGFFIYLYFHFRKLFYTNMSLVQFKELRHDSMLFLIDNIQGELPVDELEKHQVFLHGVNITVKYFDDLKIALSESVSLRSILRTIQYALAQYHSLMEKNHDVLSVQKYNQRYHGSIRTFLKTIPFYKQKLVLYVVIGIFTFLVKIGFHRLGRMLVRMKKLYNIERDFTDNNQCFN